MKFVSYDKATEFDLDALRSEEGRSGLLCISQSTWMLAYSLVAHYGYWRSRYYSVAVDGSLVKLTDAEWEEVTDVVDLAIEELSMTGCSEIVDLLTEMTASIVQASATGAAAGQLLDDQPSGGEVQFGAGQQFSSQDDYLEAKCTVANAIYDSALTLAEGDLGLVDDYLAIGGITVIIASLLAAAGPVGWTVGGVSLAVVGIAILLTSASVDFADIAAALDDVHVELVSALYAAGDATSARAAFLAVLAGATPVLTSAELRLVSLFLTDKMTNQLFSPRPDVARYQSLAPVNCVTETRIAVLSEDGGTISGSATMEAVDDTVVVVAQLNLDASGTYLVFCQRVASGVPTPGVISVAMSAFSVYCAQSIEKSAYYIQPGFQVQQSFLCSQNPGDPTGINADTWILRSGAPFTATFTLEA